MLVSNMQLNWDIHFIYPQRIQFLKFMMEDSKTYSNIYMKQNINLNLMLKRYGMNID